MNRGLRNTPRSRVSSSDYRDNFDRIFKRRVDSFALGNQLPQDVAAAGYMFVAPFGNDEVRTQTGLVALAMVLQLTSDKAGVKPEEALQVARNMLERSGSSFRTENTEHVRALKLFIEGEI